MKKINLVLIAFALSILGNLSAVGRAAPAAKFDGDFQLHPKVMHDDPITGKMTLFSDNDQVVQVQLKFDQPVRGRSDASSSEVWSQSSMNSSGAQIPVVFKLKGVPHKFYFVFLGQSKDGKITVDGPIYRVDAKLDEIQRTLQSDSPTKPDTWREVGKAILKAQ